MARARSLVISRDFLPRGRLFSSSVRDRGVNAFNPRIRAREVGSKPRLS